MSALEVNGVLTLSATRVLDLALPAVEEEDEAGQETDRAYWEGKSSASMVKMADRLLELANGQGPAMALKFNKFYIGLQRDGVPDNFVTFRPRKKHLLAEFRIEPNDELDARIEEAGLTLLGYDKRWKRYRVQLLPSEANEQQPLLNELIRMARGLPVERLDPSATSVG